MLVKVAGDILMRFQELRIVQHRRIAAQGASNFRMMLEILLDRRWRGTMRICGRISQRHLPTGSFLCTRGRGEQCGRHRGDREEEASGFQISAPTSAAVLPPYRWDAVRHRRVQKTTRPGHDARPLTRSLR